MEYLEMSRNDGSCIHFYLTCSKTEPERIFFTYQDLVKNIKEETTNVICFSGTGKRMSEFSVIKGMKGEVVICRDVI